MSKVPKLSVALLVPQVSKVPIISRILQVPLLPEVKEVSGPEIPEEQSAWKNEEINADNYNLNMYTILFTNEIPTILNAKNPECISSNSLHWAFEQRHFYFFDKYICMRSISCTVFIWTN